MLVLIVPAILGHIKNFLSVISPFLWGLLIAYLGKGLALKIENILPKAWSFNVRRVLASVITIIFVVLCLVVVVVIIFPQLITSVSSLTVSIQNFLMNPNNYSWISNLLKSNNDIINTITSNAIKKDLNNYAGFNVSNPIQSIPMQLSQSLGINIPTHLSIPKNPADLSLKVAKAAVKIIEKGYGM